MPVSKSKDHIIPTKLSDYVECLEDWELVEYASRFKATSRYCINGASRAHMLEVRRVWQKRYPEEEIPILECYPPLSSPSTEDLSDILEVGKNESR